MKKISYLIVLFISFNLSAQTEDAWVYFTDKPDATYYLANPLDMLSQRALDRRLRQDISLDTKDVPVSTSYIDQIETASGISVLAKSKWLNALHIQGSEAAINALLTLDFVLSIEFANTALNERITTQNTLAKSHARKLDIQTDFDYGQASNQIEMLGGDFLHLNNFTGAGMQIAVIDAGFTNVNTMDSFARIRDNNQILGTYNFITDTEEVYTQHYHGTMVLSTMAAYVENEFVGTAPDADYYLFISEDVSQEHPIEESYWVEAAEHADSLGVDVLNTSLGYTTFDRTAYNHTYQDMDGNTNFISRGAELAFSRGMLVINAAGNDGNSSWHYIGAPADAHSILSIGAVNADETMASFSSYGPTSDGIIKPDVCAQGGASTVINTSNSIISGNGTSFAAPILCGAATCFWQAFPDKTNIEIAKAIKNSAHLYGQPEDQYGYGIPNFETAYNTLFVATNSFEKIRIFPNPVQIGDDLRLQKPADQELQSLLIMDRLGKLILYKEGNAISNLIRIPSVTKGLYFIQIKTDTDNFIQKLLIE